MLFPRKMVKANIIAHISILEDTVDAVASAEIMQVNPVNDNLGEEIRGHLGALTTPSRHIALLEIELRMERLLDIFSTHFPSQTSMLADLFPSASNKTKVKELDSEELLARSEKVMSGIEKELLWSNDRLSEINDELARNREKKAQVSLLEPFDMPLHYLDDGTYTFTRIGTTDDVYELGKALENIPKAAFDHVSTDLPEAPNVVVITGLTEVLEDVSKALRGKIFNELQLPELKGRPKEILADLNRNIEALEEEGEMLLDELKKLKEEWIPKIEVEMELVRIKREKYETYARFGKTENTAVISGWVEEEKKDELRKCLKDLKYVEVSFSEPDLENDKVPSSLSKSRFIKPFEGLINTFSPPKYNDLNPTPFVAVMFVLFFGIMLGDAGYGLLLLIACLFIGVKIKEGFMANLAYIGKYVSVVTIITGVVTGSFFGDLLQRLIYEKNADGTLQPLYTISGVDFLPYDSLRDPLPLFMIGLGLGLLTIYLSVVLSAITHVKQKEMKTFVFGDVSLLILIPCMIILMINLLGMMDVSFLVIPALVGLGISVVLLTVINLSMPLLVLFEITGFLGDLLSFARILALGLGTVGLAMTWNIIAEMFLPLDSVGGGILKLVAILVILIFFHLFNLAFQTLGACIHSLRLQYIEFFNRCYTGGGVLFKPFRANRVFTEMRK